MNVSEITASLTDCFAKHQSKTVTRVVCIDYIPLAVYKNNMEHVCVLESHDGSDCEIVFKAHYSSDKAITGLLRDGNWGISKVLEKLDKDYAKLSSIPTDEEVKEIIDHFPSEKLHDLLIKFNDIKEASAYCSKLATAIDSALSFATRAIETGVRTSYMNIIEDIQTSLAELKVIPDHIADLLEFIGADNIQQVQNISEVYAKNILTRSDYSDNEYMIVANFELMHLFFGKFSPSKRFHTVAQRIYQALPEFIPIMMKFGGVPNPLLDVENETCLFEKLKSNFRFLRNTELVTNRCAFNGSLVDSTPEDFDYQDSGTYPMSRIVYGLVSDVDQIYTDSNIAIIPQVDGLIRGESIVYSPDLAVGIIQGALLAAMLTDNLESGYIPQNGLRKYIRLGLYMDEDNQSLKFISALQKICDRYDTTQTSADYADITLLRGVLSSRSNKSNLADVLTLRSALHEALAECTRDLLRFGDIGVDLDED